MRTPIYHQYVDTRKTHCETIQGVEHCYKVLPKADPVIGVICGLILGLVVIYILSLGSKHD